MHKEKTKLKLKNTSGITLIALIVTIIIILILAAVTLSVINNSKLFYHAKRAGFIHDMKTYQELTTLYLTDKKIEAQESHTEMSDINVGLLEYGQEDTSTLFKIENKYKANGNSPEQVLVQTVISKQDNTTKTTKMYYYNNDKIKDNADHVQWCKDYGIPIWPDGCNGTPTDPNVTIPTLNPEDGGDYPTIDRNAWIQFYEEAKIWNLEKVDDLSEEDVLKKEDVKRVDDKTNNGRIYLWNEEQENGTFTKLWSNTGKIYLPKDSSYFSQYRI